MASTVYCSTCSRAQTSSLPFHCVACARIAIYQPRLENLTTLLEREAVAKEVEELTRDPRGIDETHKSSRDPRGNRPSRWQVDQALSRTEESRERSKEIAAHIATLRQEIVHARSDISIRKAALARRRVELSSASSALVERRTSSLELIQKQTKRKLQQAAQQHQRTAESRVFLCQEAADLYGLRQRRRRKAGVVTEEYVIGGIGMMDLRNLNNIPPAQTTTALAHTSHLLVLTSHYLSLQLPCEITLPHRDYPLPTILPSTSSYTGRNIPFPGTAPTPVHSSSNSPSNSRHASNDPRPLPRPRPLYLEKALPSLAKDDPAGYALFIEGVSLLAWDVAWLCRTQGLRLGMDSNSGGEKQDGMAWEDVCDVGRNLWMLFVAPGLSLVSNQPGTPPPRPPSNSRTTSHQSSTPNSRISSNYTSTTNVITPVRPYSNLKSSPPLRSPSNPPSKTPSSSFPAPTHLGHFSHLTSDPSSALSTAQGAEFMRSQGRMPRPTQIADQLKATLLGEMTGAEWEVVGAAEWEAEEANEGPGLDRGTVDKQMIGAKGDKDRRADKKAAESGSEAGKERAGSSGWTKLKSR